ncbi:glycosyltransferase family 4 protein [Hymenobacter sp. 15J16-1T3B]|uniref:glycosyltransferase family 4 protein n=1 Tax=Hymenobacter sp. 15J16-1T3B TaxID=2886941 RepID=UPI001D0FE93B|nr:glycosyltransferase family 4 protein [Hymenobacter sp. 15J16-1T3B]MCC3157522.1 glycosyltransferase family 4 protein [Hymenobacter sp. 15J16-1T3B]
MPMPTAPSSVLLLGWDAASAALPLARQLAATTATELWTAVPLAADAEAPRGRSLDVAPPLPAVLPRLGQGAPAFPYVGRDAGPPQPVAVPAAPYAGRSEAPAEGLPSLTGHSIANGEVKAPGAPAFTAPAPPYIGAAQHADSALRHAPVPDYRVPVAALAAPPATAVAPAAGAPARVATPAATDAAAVTAAPDPTAPAAPASELPTLPAANELPVLPTDLAPTSAAESELLPEPAAEDHPGQDAVDPALPAAPAEAPDLNFRIIQYARNAARLAYESTFEVIFAPDWPTWLAGVELRQLTRRPLVLQVAQLAAELASSAAERGWMEALERITLPQADRILVPDEATAERLRQRYRQLAARVFVLPTGAPNLAAALVLDSHFLR